MERSVCGLWVDPGTTKAAKFVNGIRTGELDYFCGECFRTSRPASWYCPCQDNLKWFSERRRQKAPSAFSAFGDYANMAQVVERLQAEMFEMKQKMAELESTIGALQIAAPEQQPRAPPEGTSG